MDEIGDLKSLESFDVKPAKDGLWHTLVATHARCNDDYTPIKIEGMQDEYGHRWRFTIDKKDGCTIILLHRGKVTEHLKAIEAIALGAISISIES